MRQHSIHDKQAVGAHYEELRSGVVVGRVQGIRRGLAILVQRGMAAWMDTVSWVPSLDAAPSPQPTVARCETRLPDAHSAAPIDILANLTLNRFLEVHA